MEKKESAYRFFQHRACEFFPCHATACEEDFNCLFCYCPLYALGSACGGQFRMLEGGVKDCSACLFPHERANYDRIIARFSEIVALMNKKEIGVDKSDGK